MALAALAGPGAAWAHPRKPTVALDVRLRVTSAPANVRADVLDGDRQLRLRVNRGSQLIVRGFLGEPLLRFGANGVWVNRRSPTAAADRLINSAGRGWSQLARGSVFSWHDHRLSPPPGLRPGHPAPWSLPLLVNGRRATITGSFLRVPRPALWPWPVGAAGAAALLAVMTLGRPQHRATSATLLAGVAALAALVATWGFTAANPLNQTSEWLELACTALLAAGALAALRIRDQGTRGWVATLIGVFAAALALGSLSVFWHGVIVSTLPGTLVRLLVAIAVVAGGAACVLGVLADDRELVR